MRLKDTISAQIKEAITNIFDIISAILSFISYWSSFN